MSASNGATQTITRPSIPAGAMIRALAGVGVVCALFIVLVYQGTLPIITEKKKEALQQAVLQVVEGAGSQKPFVYVEGQGFKPAGENPTGDVVYAGFNETGDLKGIAIEAHGQGFQDILRILYGYSFDKQAVVGMQVLESRETPGLGDKIEKDPAFVANFEELDVALGLEGNSLANPVKTVKKGEKEKPWQIEGITGATISAEAIGNIINKSAQKWIPLLHKHREDFQSQASGVSS